MNKIQKAVTGASLAAATVVAGAGVAGATTPPSATTVISDGASELSTQLLAVGGAGLTAGVAIVALRKGWRLVKGFFG